MSPSTPPKKKGRPLKEKLPDTVSKALTIAAASGDKNAVAKLIGQASQTPAPSNRNITDEILEVIVTRVSAGELLRTVCRDLEVSAALVRRRGYDQPETVGRRLREARMMMADELFDTMLEVADDKSLSVEERKLKIMVLKDYAKVHNRAVYGDKVEIEQRTLNITLDKGDVGLC